MAPKRRDKQTGRREQPKNKKAPVIGPASPDGDPAAVMWRFGSVDHEHSKIGWDRATTKELQRIRRKLVMWEQLDRRTFCDRDERKQIPVSEIKTFARARLQTLFQNEEMPEYLYRMKVDEKARVWVYPRGRCFEFVWWDPDHLVAP